MKRALHELVDLLPDTFPMRNTVYLLIIIGLICWFVKGCDSLPSPPKPGPDHDQEVIVALPDQFTPEKLAIVQTSLTMMGEATAGNGDRLAIWTQGTTNMAQVSECTHIINHWSSAFSNDDSNEQISKAKAFFVRK